MKLLLCLITTMLIVSGCIPIFSSNNQRNYSIPTQDRYSLASDYYSSGLDHYENGRYEQALEDLKQVYALMQAEGDWKVQAYVLHDIGNAYFGLGDYEAARINLEKSLSMLRQLPDRNQDVKSVEALTLHDLGWTLEQLNQPNEAEAYYLEALQLRRELGDSFGEAETLRNLASVNITQAQFSEGVDYAQEALKAWQKLANQSEQVKVLNTLAIAYYQQGKYDDSLTTFEQGIALAERTGNEVGLAHLKGNRAFVLDSIGDSDSALAELNDVLLSVRSQGDKEQEQDALHDIAWNLMDQGEYAKAEENFRAAIALAQELQDVGDEVLASIGLAWNFAHQNDNEKALEIFMNALELARKANDKKNEQVVLLNLGTFYVATREDQLAENAYKDALTLSSSLGEWHNNGIYDDLAYLYFRQERYDEALAIYNETLRQSQNTGDLEFQRASLSYLAQIYEHRGMHDEALRYYLETLVVHEQIRDLQRLEATKIREDERFNEEYEKGVRLLVEATKPLEAFELSEQARARTFLDQLGNNLPKVLSETNTAKELQGVSQQITDLEQEKNAELAKGISADQNRITALISQIEQLQQDYSNVLDRLKLQNPEYASLLTVNPLTLEETRDLLQNTETLISYFVTQAQTFAFVVSAERFEVIPLGVGENELLELLTAFRGSFDSTSPEDVSPSKRPLADLHQLLIQPLLERNLLTTEHLIIVPHRILNSLPFAALWDETNQHYLGEQYTLSYLPSASVLPFIEQKSTNNPNEQRLLAMANARAEGFTYLASATQEAVETASLYGVSPYLDQDATETRFKLEATGKDIILLSAHGELSEETPLFSRIVLTPDEEGQNDGSLTVQEIYELDLREANLVVLSACETNGGQLTRGDDLTGLSRAFIYAGTPSIVASLWKVNDEATRLLVTTFLAEYRQGRSAAEALSVARAAVRNTPEYIHPYYWAGFVLVGLP